jgi:hypothetical protein
VNGRVRLDLDDFSTSDGGQGVQVGKMEPQQLASWEAENPAQQIRARFTPEGMQVETKSGDGPPRRIGMKLRSVGYG